MTKIVKIGLIGTGVGLRTYLPAFKDIHDSEVLVISGSSIERATKLAQQHGIKHAMSYQDLCKHPEIDLVCVTSPNLYHREQVVAALRAGKHVLCEKPLAMNVNETRELINISSAHSGQLALVNHQLRFNPYLRKVKQLLEEGRLGRPYFLRMHQQSTGFSDRQATWSWSFDATQGGGVRLAMGSHLIDLVIYWLGERVKHVSGSLDPVVSYRCNSDNVKVPVSASGFFSASLQFAEGLSVQLSATAASCSSPAFEFNLFGEEGELHFNLSDKLTGAFLDNRGETVEISVDGVSEEERANRVSIFSGSFPYYAEEIIRSIQNSEWMTLAPAATFSDALVTQNVLDALKSAATTGEAQSL